MATNLLHLDQWQTKDSLFNYYIIIIQVQPPEEIRRHAEFRQLRKAVINQEYNFRKDQVSEKIQQGKHANYPKYFPSKLYYK